MDTWVLLRGLTREHAHWGSFLAELGSALPHARIVTPDLPGAGLLWQERSPLRIEGMVDAVRQQLARDGCAPPYHVVGMSLGGMVAAAWAAAWPRELAAVALVNSSMRPFSPPQRRLRPSRLPGLIGMLMDANVRRVAERVLRLTSSRPEAHGERVNDWMAIREARPVSSSNAVRQLAAAARYRHGAGVPAATVLVIASRGDALVDPRCSLDLVAAWGADCVMHSSAGHDLALDDGPWLAHELALWRARLRGP